MLQHKTIMIQHKGKETRCNTKVKQQRKRAWYNTMFLQNKCMIKQKGKKIRMSEHGTNRG